MLIFSILYVVFLVLYLSVFGDTANKSCEFHPQVWLNNGSLANVSLQSDSSLCDEKLRTLDASAVCPPDIAEVYFSPAVFLPNGTNIYPYIDLNVTVISRTLATDLFVQLECLYAPNKENTYCHHPEVSIARWGRFVRPCRQQIIALGQDVELPFIFEHSCFRMHGLSQYRMNITFSPNNCHLSYLVTLPLDKQVEPEIAQFYEPTMSLDLSKVPWSPMVILDMNSDDLILIKFVRAKYFAKSAITVKLYEQFTGGSKLVLSEIVHPPASEVRANIPAGDYMIYVYLDHPHCRLNCQGLEGCTPCHNTPFNFTLTSHKLNGLQSVWYGIIVFAKYSLVIILSLTVIGLLVACTIFFYIHCIRRRVVHQRPFQYEMAETPNVLFLYTYDCRKHLTCVRSLVDMVHERANANIHFDVLETTTTDLCERPVEWLKRSIEAAKFVIIIFSACSQRVLDGEELDVERDFIELFPLGIDIIQAQVTQILSDPQYEPASPELAADPALNKFIVARFGYTNESAIPDYFRLLRCRHVVIPNDLPLLFGMLHDVDLTGLPVQEVITPNHISVNMQDFIDFTERNPNWIDLSFKARSPGPSGTSHPRGTAERLPVAAENDGATAVERVAQQVGADVPVSSDEDEALPRQQETYQLIQNPEVASRSSGGTE